MVAFYLALYRYGHHLLHFRFIITLRIFFHGGKWRITNAVLILARFLFYNLLRNLLTPISIYTAHLAQVGLPQTLTQTLQISVVIFFWRLNDRARQFQPILPFSEIRIRILCDFVFYYLIIPIKFLPLILKKCALIKVLVLNLINTHLWPLFRVAATASMWNHGCELPLLLYFLYFHIPRQMRHLAVIGFVCQKLRLQLIVHVVGATGSSGFHFGETVEILGPLSHQILSFLSLFIRDLFSRFLMPCNAVSVGDKPATIILILHKIIHW